MRSKGFFLEMSIKLKVWGQNKRNEPEFAVGEEDWYDYFEVWWGWRFSVKRENGFRCNSNSSRGGLKAFASAMNSMKKIRRLDIQCKWYDLNWGEGGFQVRWGQMWMLNGEKKFAKNI